MKQIPYIAVSSNLKAIFTDITGRIQCIGIKQHHPNYKATFISSYYNIYQFSLLYFEKSIQLRSTKVQAILGRFLNVIERNESRMQQYTNK